MKHQRIELSKREVNQSIKYGLILIVLIWFLASCSGQKSITICDKVHRDYVGY